MKWMLAGLLFALAVVAAIATVAVRAENVRTRYRIERAYRAVEDRIVELRRLSLERLEAAAPPRLAMLHRQWLEREAARRTEDLR